jgi:hypothetical protein
MAKQTLRVELIALADYAMNSEDKKLSLIGIFDKLFVRSLPSQHPRIAFVVTLIGHSHSEEKLTMRILSPSNKEEFRTDVTVAFGENEKANLVSNFEGFPIKEIGTYRFILEEAGKEIAGYDLSVIQVKDQSEQKVVG